MKTWMTTERVAGLLVAAPWVGFVIQLGSVLLTTLRFRDTWSPSVLTAQSVILTVTALMIWRTRALQAEHQEKLGRYVAERKMSEIMLEKMTNATMVQTEIEVETDDDGPSRRRH